MPVAEELGFFSSYSGWGNSIKTTTMLVERAGNKAAQHVFFPTSTHIIIQNRVGQFTSFMASKTEDFYPTSRASACYRKLYIIARDFGAKTGENLCQIKRF